MNYCNKTTVHIVKMPHFPKLYNTSLSAIAYKVCSYASYPAVLWSSRYIRIWPDATYYVRYSANLIWKISNYSNTWRSHFVHSIHTFWCSCTIPEVSNVLFTARICHMLLDILPSFILLIIRIYDSKTLADHIVKIVRIIIQT